MQLVALLVVIVVALRIVDLDPRAIAVGGAVTAVVLGLAAQSTIGNVIAGMVLLASRPFRAGDRVRLQGGPLGKDVEGTVASLGLIYTTVARGGGHAAGPQQRGAGGDGRPAAQSRRDRPARPPARGRAAERPAGDAGRRSRRRCATSPDISLEEIYSDGAVVRITATPVLDEDGARLADEVLAVVSQVAAPAPQ